jgi:pyruvate/2-oxoglutarate dehydrogenase complex dihydrolipoamide dehydrogenase (E3) component
VRFTDGTERPFDVVILATGFRSALGFLDVPVRTDARGFAVRTDRVRSTDAPALYFVGHNYDSTGGLMNIATDSRLAAMAIAEDEPRVAEEPSRPSHR